MKCSFSLSGVSAFAVVGRRRAKLRLAKERERKETLVDQTKGADNAAEAKAKVHTLVNRRHSKFGLCDIYYLHKKMNGWLHTDGMLVVGI